MPPDFYRQQILPNIPTVRLQHGPLPWLVTWPLGNMRGYATEAQARAAMGRLFP